MYVWADGVHFNVRLEEDRLCCLVIVGVRADGTKELVAIADGYRESTESLGRPAARPAPARDAGPGARRRRRGAGVLGGAARRVPRDPQQRCWVHKVANVLSALPSSAQPTARRMLAEIRDAEDREHAVARDQRVRARVRGEVAQGGRQDRRRRSTQLLAFYDFPAEHWVHLKTTNPIESTFATVRLRTKVTKGPGSRAAGLAMAFKLIEAAQDRWRAVNGPHLVALVRAGATLREGGARRATEQQIRKPPRDQRRNPIHRS